MNKSRIVALALQAGGVVVASVSAAAVHVALGGAVLACGMLAFGIAVERGEF